MTRKRQRKKNVLKAVLIVLAVYFALVAVGAFLFDGRHAEIDLAGPESIELEFGEPYLEQGANAYTTGRLFPGKELKLSIFGNEAISEPGEYTVVYSCEYRGKQASTERKVTVKDTVAPIISLVPTVDFNAKKDTGYIEPGYSAYDNHDGDLSGSVKAELNGNIIVYSVSDASGNTARAEREIIYAPESPTIVLDGETSLTVTAAISFPEPGFRAYDGNGNDISGTVQVGIRGDKNTGTGNTTDSPPAGANSNAPSANDLQPFTPYLTGTYELIYSVTTADGLKTEAKREVTVVPADMPESKSPSKPTIYLTFDDGPGPYTEELLGILKKNGVKATFFVTNQFPDYIYLIAKEYEAGHSVAVHTYSHVYKDIYAGVEEYWSDFQKMRELIYQQTGAYTNLFRFPGGTSNTESRFTPGIMTTLSKAMPNMGYKAFDWNVDSRDAGGATNPDSVYNNTISGIQLQINTFGYAVVLQHDIKEYSVHAVEQIIQWGKAQGYTFAALDMSSPRAWHNPAN